jgi:LPXTG-site transpeptidase (sortase) family protein
MLREIRDNKWRFLGTFFLVFFLSFLILTALGFAPFQAEGTTEEGAVRAPETSFVSEYPSRIVIEEIGVDASVSNPTSRDVAVLDAALLKGAVRYPGSGKLGERSTVLLFGHSSFLKLVHNPAFRAFNNLHKLSAGDEIRVESGTREYVYRVTSVRHVEVAEEVVRLETGGNPKLVLATCDSFGEESDRYVVEADLVASYLLAK